MSEPFSAPAARPLLALIALVLACPEAAAEDERYDVKLTVYDQLVLPGEPITLLAKLEHVGVAGLNFDMWGDRLRFTIPTYLDLEARTDHDGVATLTVRTSGQPIGPDRVRVRFAGSHHHRPAEATAHIFVWPADSPIAVVDVDHTISDLRELDVLFYENADIPTLPGAAETLAKLARNYRIVYLTARDHGMYVKTRAWLDAHGFPDGPLFTRDFHVWESRGTFKSQFIARLRERFPNVAVGVGDRVDDARAYLDNGLKAIVIDPTREGRFPDHTLAVPSWHEIGALLVPDPEKSPGVRVSRSNRSQAPARPREPATDH